ncbi:COG2426 family protein [Archaeoglobus veneficus]|uniref:Small multi-drug export protein n=1 Tax=Archaeoglobus veneficus (strain DSM 11195 / SNP6) TaxID=693661 RepID=F2KP79_ARCVS|nr:small multi-drug export protein [Archaeoglobus veneficus]AEA47483.1 small multi-drug export protein [Archaeoglobus veneficus SNP6]
MLDIIFLAAMPVSELRGAIPLALYRGYPPLEAYAIAVAGNLIPVPILLLLLHHIRTIAFKWKFTARALSWVEKRTLKRRGLIDRYGYFGLTLFVAIPMPVTGAWTGALLATLLNLSPGKALVFISAGVLVAGVIVTLTTIGAFNAII